MSYLPTPPGEPSLPAREATVYLPTPFHPLTEVYAQERFKRVLRVGQDELTEEDCLEACDGVLLRIGDMPASKLEKARNLRIISRNGTGCDSIDLQYARERGIAVTNCPGGNAKAVAELALTLMLSLMRRVKEFDARITSGEICPSITALSPGLSGKTVGLVGMGDTAYELAKFLLPFDCTILVFSPSSPLDRWSGSGPTASRYPTRIPHTRIDSLESLLRNVDVLSLHCPLTPHTRNMIGAAELTWMKKEAVIINVARGGIIDERALELALTEGRIGGAGLDVFDYEPAHGETLGGLGKMHNVICLPHLGGSTDKVTYDGCKMAIDIMADFFDGKGIRNRVV